mgnify:CR=1 FL=1
MWIMWISPLLLWICTHPCSVYTHSGGFLRKCRRFSPSVGRNVNIHAYMMHIHATPRIGWWGKGGDKHVEKPCISFWGGRAGAFGDLIYPLSQNRNTLAPARACVHAGARPADGRDHLRGSRPRRLRRRRARAKDVNLAVALCLRQELQAAGAQVILTRDTDTALAEEGAQRKRRDLQYRVDAAREARLFLSIHMNEYRTRAESGPQVFYRAGQEDSRLLAGALQAQLIAGLHPARERSAHTGEYYLLEHLDIPAVLVECGFLSNAAEEAKLLDAGYQQQVAQAICAGVCDFIQLSGK